MGLGAKYDLAYSNAQPHDSLLTIIQMPLTELPLNLSGKVFRSAMPFCYFDIENALFDAYLDVGIDTVVMLTSDEEARKHSGLNLREFYSEAGMDVLYYPVTDFSTPADSASFSEAVDNAIQQVRDGKNIVIHCYAGIGRTGMFAALMVRRILGFEGDDAINWVRKFVPDAVQTPEQRHIILNNAEK